MHVARVPVGAIEDPSQYQYWNGSSFSADQNPATSPVILQPPAGYTGVGEPNVHFYDNKALLTFNDDSGNVFTSSSTDGINWSTPQLVTSQPGAYGILPIPVVRWGLRRCLDLAVESLRHSACPDPELRHPRIGDVLVRIAITPIAVFVALAAAGCTPSGESVSNQSTSSQVPSSTTTTESTTAHAPPIAGFPDLSNYTEDTSGSYEVINSPRTQGFAFSTPNGLICMSNAYPDVEFEMVGCRGPMPHEGPGDWKVAARHNQADDCRKRSLAIAITRRP